MRTLVFGPEENFVHHLGLHIATLPLGRPAADPATILMYTGWRIPEAPDLLERVRTAEDLYFDSISRVRLPTWSLGRVALLVPATRTGLTIRDLTAHLLPRLPPEHGGPPAPG
ncbi:hypothetical protein FHX82_005123 [Amycolatopsis bartoniae]|uniref:hypothetical protein n=1 Tax=Amycolatopsis bartoniae TaxID=941986 RepID=UPI0018173755|nr:hypothetical protein [Amycolatopsis bartoniae]MBB2938047.1 hypothetical protein [Amycolatopsis bartoniae]